MIEEMPILPASRWANYVVDKYQLYCEWVRVIEGKYREAATAKDAYSLEKN